MRRKERTESVPFSTELPRGELRGTFMITEGAVTAAERLLPSFRGPDGDHEGMAFLLGRELRELTIFTSVLAPDADHGEGHVVCDPSAVSGAQRASREHGLAILGQVHSHPGSSTEHSEGDDTLILMPFEGMVSLVVPWYGRVGLRPLSGLGVHQYQDGRWVLIESNSVRKRLTVVPTWIDLR
jgi:proteasome lid subunit RPN8/RPN11